MRFTSPKRPVARFRSLADIARKRETDESMVQNLQSGSPPLLTIYMLQNLLKLAANVSQPSGWVYVLPTVRMVEHQQLCKIGFSTDPDERFKSLCTNNPHALDLANTRAFPGNLEMESMLKRWTLPFVTDGANEWRSFPQEVYGLIAQTLPLFPWNSSCEERRLLKKRKRTETVGALRSSPRLVEKRIKHLSEPML